MDELRRRRTSIRWTSAWRHLENPRLRAVLEEAAGNFDWREKVKRKAPGVGVGLACGTEKGSYVAACAEVEFVDNKLKVLSVCEAYDCGAIVNPRNLPRRSKEPSSKVSAGPSTNPSNSKMAG